MARGTRALAALFGHASGEQKQAAECASETCPCVQHRADASVQRPCRASDSRAARSHAESQRSPRRRLLVGS